MAIQETARGDSYGNVTQNYLYDWCRRTGNVANIANYYVEDKLDGSTGFITFYLRDIADKTASSSVDSADPVAVDFSAPGDTTVAAEDASQQ